MATRKIPTEIPEADAIKGLALPRAQTALIGQDHAERTLLEAYRSGRIHHAWLMTGAKGIGKATLAYRLARFILAHPDPTSDHVANARDLSVDPQGAVAHMVAAASHPDLLVISRRFDPERNRMAAGISAAEARRSTSFFGSTAAGGGWRIAIVDAVDEMNAVAANAILKILEEPPRRGLFLLVSHQPGRLLPTIRSRCRHIGLKALAPGDIRAALHALGTARGHDDDELELAGRLADGSLRRAILLLDAGGIALYRDFRDLIGNLPLLDVEALHEFANRVTAARNPDAYDVFIDLMRGWLHRRIRQEEEPEMAGLRPTPMLHQVALVSWAEVWEKIARSTGHAESLNLDRKQVVLSSFRALAEAAR